VPLSYYVNFQKGRIDSPGYEKMRAIAKATGFSPEASFEETRGDRAHLGPTGKQDLAGSVRHLFETMVYPRTGEPYTNAEVVRMSLGMPRGRTSKA
jgi:hypothetical protein